MKFFLYLCGVFISTVIFASENQLYSENKQALINFGLGVVEALDDPIQVEDGPLLVSFHEPNKKLKISIEKYKNFTIQKIRASEDQIFVYSLLATGRDLTLPFGGPMRILQTGDLEMALGSPDKRTDNYFEYLISDQIGTNKITFNYSKLGVESILWQWDID